MTRILITNAYSARNRGDGAIVLGMLRSLGDAFGNDDVEFTISSADYPADREHYPVPVVPSFHSLMGTVSCSGTLQGLYFLGVLLPFSILGALARRFLARAIPLPAGLGPLLDAYARADLVVAAGGGYLYTTAKGRGTVMLLVHLHSFMMGRILGKPLYLYAQSIGPFAGRLQGRLVRAALRRVRLVEVREEWSARLVAGWKLPTPVSRAADAAFLLEPRPPRPDPLGPGGTGLRVGVTVRHWLENDAAQAAYEEAVAAFLDTIERRHGAEIVFLPQVTVGARSDDDRDTAQRILGRLAPGTGARLLEGDPSPGEMLWICGHLHCLVGTRMHSNIFGLAMGVPVVAIAYQPKTNGIMAQLGLEEYVLQMERLDPAELLALFEKMLHQRAVITGELKRRLPAIRRSALEAGALIAGDFRRSRKVAHAGGNP